MTRCNNTGHSVVAAAFFGWILFLHLLMPAFADPKEIEITSFYAKVYVAPSKNANFIGLTQKGERYPILGTRGPWYHIRFKNVNGWIAATEVTVTGPGVATPPVASVPSNERQVDTVAPRSVSVDSPDATREGVSGRLPTTSGREAADAVSYRSEGRSTSSRQSVQSSSSQRSADRSAKSPEKKESRLRSWFTQQKLPELPPTLYPDSQQQTELQAIRYFQITYPVRVLEYLSPDAPMLGMTRRGDLLPLIAEGDSWCRVAYGDTVGWIEKKHGRIIDPETAASIDYIKVGSIGGVLVVIIIVLLVIIIRLVRRRRPAVVDKVAEKHAIILARTVKNIEYTLTNGNTTLERCFSEVGFSVMHIRDILQLKDAIQQIRPEVVLIDYQFEKNVIATIERSCAHLDHNSALLYLVYNVPDPAMKPGTALPKLAFLGPKFSDRDLFKLVTPMLRTTTGGGHIKKSVQSSALAGDIAAGNLLEVLQFIEIGSKTGCLLVELEMPFAIICFKNGRIVFAATAEKITGRDAIFKVLELKTGKFRFVLDKKPRESNVNLSTFEVLMEWAKATDEANR